MKRFFIFVLILLLVVAAPLILQYVRHEAQAVFLCPDSMIESGGNGPGTMEDTALCFYTDRTFSLYAWSGTEYEEYSKGTYTADFDWETFGLNGQDGHPVTMHVTGERGTDGVMKQADRVLEYDPDRTRDSFLKGTDFRTDRLSGSSQKKPLIADEGCTFALSEDGEQVIVTGAPAADRKGSMLVPAAVGGRKVAALCAAFIPESVTEVFLPAGAELLDPGRLSHAVDVFLYKDYGMVEAEKYLLYPFASVQPGEYAISDALRYDAFGSAARMKLDFCEYPAELNGGRVHNCLDGNDYYKLYTGGDGVFTYYRISEEEIGICSVLDHTSQVLEIPEQIDGMKVTALRSLTYSDRVIYTYGARQIVLPSTLKELGNYAIHTKWDTQITLPEGLETLGSHAIKSLLTKKVVIPSSVTALGVNALEINMPTLEVPKSVRTLPISAFSVSQYSKIVLPEGLEVIPARMCMGCDKLTDIRIPDSVVKIGKYAFQNCRKLQKIKMPGSALEICEGAFSGCIKLNNVEIPSSVVRIGPAAFSGCTGLSAVTIPDSVQEIADDAFADCPRLTITARKGSYALGWAESKGFRTKVKK